MAARGRGPACDASARSVAPVVPAMEEMRQEDFAAPPLAYEYL